MGTMYAFQARLSVSLSNFGTVLEKKYETGKYITFKSNRIISFRNEWKSYEKLLLIY